MLQSLEIRNYRNLRYLTIEKLGRVNLVLGKNNTGKTSLLEAISIYINRGDVDHLLQLLDERGENYVRSDNYPRKPIDLARDNPVLKTLSALFTYRRMQFTEASGILIGETDQSLFGPIVSSSSRVLIRFVKYVEEFEESDVDRPNRRKRLYVDEENMGIDVQLGLEIRTGQSTSLFPVNVFNRANRVVGTRGLASFENPTDRYQFVKTKYGDRGDLSGALWDRIALTPGEDEVINALKIIGNDIDRITFRNERGQERTAVVKLRTTDDIVPLRSMGDGVNRILTVILALVNCENGYLLIDEFENGLHYTVQERLWEVIFDVAERLNIQVFATTHSYDCIDAFSTVLNNGKYSKEFGCMIRLENYEGTIEATLYNADEVQSTTRVQVDPR